MVNTSVPVTFEGFRLVNTVCFTDILIFRSGICQKLNDCQVGSIIWRAFVFARFSSTSYCSSFQKTFSGGTWARHDLQVPVIVGRAKASISLLH
ncbi:hypothetical protein SCLCIDRAFT_466913 [Scleroderma citrinum Foug A]|uniref:Uncharacterized protein n=1 Tax=Scleroderma citrinum Foug A TaxID=1036808 RepID=A0A0C2YTP2_9AGAM|nr:hypothetical protein SCLCIDRAFT_466913 [Scleroderma citrinum Foug A]